MPVPVPDELAGLVRQAVIAYLRERLADDRDRGGTPFNSAPYVALCRDLAAAQVAAARHGGRPTVGGRRWPGRTLVDLADVRGRSVRSLQRDCAAGRIPAVKVGSVWLAMIDDDMEDHSGPDDQQAADRQRR